MLEIETTEPPLIGEPEHAHTVSAAMAAGARAYASTQDVGIVAAVHLLSEYDDGRLLLEASVARHLHWVPGKKEILVDWVSLFDAQSLRSPKHNQTEQTWAVLLIACSLAIGRALHRFGTLLSYLDHRAASQVIRAIYIATHDGAQPAPGWPDTEPVMLGILAEVEAAFVKARDPQD